MVERGSTSAMHAILETRAGYETALHAHHDHTMLLFPTSGTIRASLEVRPALSWAAPRDVLIVPPGSVHATRAAGAGARHVAIYVERDFEAYLCRRAGARQPQGGGEIWTLGRDARDLVGLLERNLDRPASDNHEAEMRADTCCSLAELLVRDCLLRSGASRNVQPALSVRHGAHLVQAALDAMGSELTSPVCLDRLACELGVSRRHLTRLFRRHCGTSLAQAHLELRLKEARRLLVSSDLSVQAVAFEAGFQNASSFARAFARRFGVAPRAMRMARSAH